jgi:predicted MFS family arabinose efflux permease
MGYALGAIIAGTVADALGYGGAIAVVAGLTAASGLWVLRDMPTDRHRPTEAVTPPPASARVEARAS